ncbi:MAG: hypothetical protein ABJH52_02695 [Henriciella sp.]
MTAIDPIIPKLLKIKQRDQEGRLTAIMGEMRDLERKLLELSKERANLDARDDGFARLSVENGYLRYLSHRQDLLTARITNLKEQAKTVQAELRKTVFSASALQ